MAKLEKIEFITTVTKRFLVAGFEAAVDIKESHWQGMDDVKSYLKANIEKIGNKVQPVRFIGMWEADPVADYSKEQNHSKRLYFFGVEVSGFNNTPASCKTKNLPESTYAVFKGQAHGLPKYDWLKANGYEPDTEFQQKYALDMEIFNEIDQDGFEWEVLIPVKNGISKERSKNG